MRYVNRREFVALAASFGASLACGGRPTLSVRTWVERRDLFAEGIASGDPDSTSVLLWTRASSGTADAVDLTLEVAEDDRFTRVVATAAARAARDTDYTCRVLAAGLQQNRTYWYRFTDAQGRGTRIGRTRTAPGVDEAVPLRFAFVSCQNICEGAQHAYRDGRRNSGSAASRVRRRRSRWPPTRPGSSISRRASPARMERRRSASWLRRCGTLR